MQRKTPKLLHDIHQAAAAIQSWTASRSLDDYRGDAMLRAAVERNFEIVGEAPHWSNQSELPKSQKCAHDPSDYETRGHRTGCGFLASLSFS